VEVRKTLRLPQELYDSIDDFCKRNGYTWSAGARHLLKVGLEAENE